MTIKTEFNEAELNKSPASIWTWTEPRVIFELIAFYSLRRRLKKLPKGDGHAVIVIPGFLGTDGSIISLRNLLRDLGYRPHGWGLGQNKAFNDGRIEALGQRIKLRSEETGRKVSLIGWSLGGIFAREVAKKYPEYVRQVITMGSPISGNFNHTFAYKIYKRMNGQPTEADLEFYKTINTAPPVPTTSIYSKSDGIVAWRNSIQRPQKDTENIRIKASHCGMGVNPGVMTVLADRLSQTDGQWRPYKA